MSEYDGFRVDHDAESGVATITLDVPGKFNRVSMLARDQLSELFAQLDRDDSVRFVVLTGAGGQFTAGGDIAGFLTKSPWVVSQLAKNVAAPERCSKPVIGKLQGYVFGVGLELALACDFRIAADDMQMALPEATIGMIAGSGGTQRLARLVGLGRAKDIVMRGRRVEAEEALRIGLVTEVVTAEQLDGAVAALIAELSRHSPLSLAMAKRVLNTVYDGPLHVGLEARRSRLRAPPADPRLPRGRGGLRREAKARVRRHLSRRTARGGDRRFRPTHGGVAYRRSPARPAARTVSSSGATNCMFPTARPAPADQVDPAQGRREWQPGPRSRSASSGGSSTAKHGLTSRSTSGRLVRQARSPSYAVATAAGSTCRPDSSFGRITGPYSSARGRGRSHGGCAPPRAGNGHMSSRAAGTRTDDDPRAEALEIPDPRVHGIARLRRPPIADLGGPPQEADREIIWKRRKLLTPKLLMNCLIFCGFQTICPLKLGKMYLLICSPLKR